MTRRVRECLIVTAMLLLAGIVFTIGINWGLPSRKTDAYLFGDRTPWSGAEILKLAPQRSGSAADVDVNPAARGSVINDTDAKRAEIVRRYRLFTYQPDEMITLMSLAGMHPSQGDFDPRLYQYGGLWIYPVGGLIKLLLHPRNDQAYYLDHPEAFGQFYIVARAYSAAWGVVGAAAVYALMRRLSRSAAILATLLYITTPVVVNMAHGAKPHLAGTSLMLLAALAGRTYIERGGWRRLMLTSALCGAAAGMILSAIVAPIIAMVAIVLRATHDSKEVSSLSARRERAGRGEDVGGVSHVIEPREQRHHSPGPNPRPRERGRGDPSRWTKVVVRLAWSLAIAAGVYAATNPYVIKHLLFDRAVLVQNLGNSKAMYHVSGFQGVRRALELIAAGCGWLVLIGSAVGLLALAASRWRHRTISAAASSAPAPSSAAGLSTAVLGSADDPANVETSGLKPAAEDDAFGARSTQMVLASTLWPLLGVSIVVMIQFAVLAAGKPGEYGRFALVIDVTLALVLAATLQLVRGKHRVLSIYLLLTFANGGLSFCYVHGFWADSRDTTRRDELAATLGNLQSERGWTTLGVVDEPAPYLLPPVDLWKWKITLLPHDVTLATAGTQVLVRPVDRPVLHVDSDTPYEDVSHFDPIDLVPAVMSWADKRIEVWAKRMPPATREVIQ